MDNDLSDELRTFAVSEDNLIEGLYHPNLPIAAVQWYPERKSPNKSINDKFIAGNDYKTKTSFPLISYEWFPKRAKYFLKEYDFPVFPDDFAYYLLKDNKTLVMISAVKNLNANFKFDISEKKLELYPKNGKFDFIISSIAKNCGHDNFKENYKCSFYKPLISSTLIN